MRFLLAAIIGLAAPGFCQTADTQTAAKGQCVLLKSGVVVKGEIKDISMEALVIATDSGEQTYPPESVESVYSQVQGTDPCPKPQPQAKGSCVRLKSGETLRGEVRQTAETVTVSLSGTERTVSTDTVESIYPQKAGDNPCEAPAPAAVQASSSTATPSISSETAKIPVATAPAAVTPPAQAAVQQAVVPQQPTAAKQEFAPQQEQIKQAPQASSGAPAKTAEAKPQEPKKQAQEQRASARDSRKRRTDTVLSTGNEKKSFAIVLGMWNPSIKINYAESGVSGQADADGMGVYYGARFTYKISERLEAGLEAGIFSLQTKSQDKADHSVKTSGDIMQGIAVLYYRPDVKMFAAPYFMFDAGYSRTKVNYVITQYSSTQENGYSASASQPIFAIGAGLEKKLADMEGGIELKWNRISQKSELSDSSSGFLSLTARLGWRFN